MNKVELAKRLARLSRRSRARAADEVDALVHDLLMKMKGVDGKNAGGSRPVSRASAPREKE